MWNESLNGLDIENWKWRHTPRCASSEQPPAGRLLASRNEHKKAPKPSFGVFLSVLFAEQHTVVLDIELFQQVADGEVLFLLAADIDDDRGLNESGGPPPQAVVDEVVLARSAKPPPPYGCYQLLKQQMYFFCTFARNLVCIIDFVCYNRRSAFAL